jgi:hypothetical protein
MKKLVFRNGIYTVLRPLYYLCKVFGLASYSYAADRRNKRVTPDYGYMNYFFTVLLLVVFTVGLPVQILTLRSFISGSKTLFISFMLYFISSYTSSIVAVVWISIIKRRRFLEIIEHISEVDNKIRYTLQEETNMNRKVMFNIILEIILLTVIQCAMTSHHIYFMAGEPYYIIVIQIIGYMPDICNTLYLFQFVNLVFIVKQRYSQLNKLLSNWVTVTMSRKINLMEENESFFRSRRTVGKPNIIIVGVSSVGSIEGTLKETDIHLLRQIYSDLYDITCLINESYGVPILANMCWLLVGVLCTLYEALTSLKEWGVEDITYTISFSVLFFKVMYFCHTAENEGRSSGILVQKLLLGGKCRNECVNVLKMFSFQLQVMKVEYTACGFFTLNLSLFASVVSVIISYIVIMVQIK